MIDTYFPLPIQNLESHFKEFSEILIKRQSGILSGLPSSPQSGYLKFILQDRNTFTKIFGKNEDTTIVFFEPIEIINSGEYSWLYQLSVKLFEEEIGYIHPESTDPTIIYISIQKFLIDLTKANKHLAIILENYAFWQSQSENSAKLIMGLFNTHHRPPYNPISFIFMTNCVDNTLLISNRFFQAVRYITGENTLFFPTLSKEETSYTIMRFSKMWNLPIPQKLFSKIYEITGGYYSPIIDLIKIIKDQKIQATLNNINKVVLKNDIFITNFIEIWNSLTISQQIELENAAQNLGINENSTLIKLGLVNKNGKVLSSFLNEFVQNKQYLPQQEIKFISSEVSYLSVNEKKVLTIAMSNNDHVISREGIATTIWGTQLKNKYSEWAIDKHVSRIRQKLKTNNSKYSIATLKNKGYLIEVK